MIVRERGPRPACERIGDQQVMSYRDKRCPRLKNRKRGIGFQAQIWQCQYRTAC